MPKIKRYLFRDKKGLVHSMLEYDLDKKEYAMHINPYLTVIERTAFEVNNS